MTFKWFKKPKRARRPSVLMEKVDAIQRSVEAIERTLSQQAAQKSVAQPVHNHDTDTAPFEPDEPFAEPETNDE